MNFRTTFSSEFERKKYFDEQAEIITRRHREAIMEENIRFSQDLRLLSKAEKESVVEEDQA